MAGTRAQEKTDPLVLLGKQLLGRYTIQNRLAHGGMSVIYVAQDDRLQRPVCVKIFFALDRNAPVYKACYEHFVQEAFALSQLSHPNTIRIYDFGYLEEEPRSPFHVSELMDGGTLRDQVRKSGVLSLRRCAEILEPLVGALGEAHGRGIVHRDIKPSNILFGHAGSRQVVKLADFGIAKAHLADELPNRADDTRSLEGKRISFFSPAWAAPEQLRGREVGPTADVFALGLMLVFMLSGKKVYDDRDLPKMLEQRAAGDTFLEQRLGELSIPPQAARLVASACKNDVAARFQTVDDFMLALRKQVIGVEEATTARFPKTAPTEVDTATQELVLPRLEPGDVVVAGRRVRVLAAAGEHVDLEGPQRFRLTLLPDGRLHIKGLNCFVSKPGARTSGAVDLDGDVEVTVLGGDRKPAGSIRCAFGAQSGESRAFPLMHARLVVPSAGDAVLLDFGEGRDAVLLYRAPTLRRGAS